MATTAEVRAALIQAFADSKAKPASEVESKIAVAGGDDAFVVRSKVAEAVIARLERLLGVTLPAPADLDRDQFATIGALVAVLAPLLVSVAIPQTVTAR